MSALSDALTVLADYLEDTSGQEAEIHAYFESLTDLELVAFIRENCPGQQDFSPAHGVLPLLPAVPPCVANWLQSISVAGS
jgi:hypothetical protein